MARLRDSQGHKLVITQSQLDANEFPVCGICGWRYSTADLVDVPVAPVAPPEPFPEPFDDEPQSETDE